MNHAMEPTERVATRVRGIRCFRCDLAHDPRLLLGTCTACGGPLRVDYDLHGARGMRAALASRPPSLWRYEEVLPVAAAEAVTLVEGFTPLVAVEPGFWIKDESRNPTGSFKARGMTAAVTMAKRLGARALRAPSAGNAAGALAAYGARAGLPVTVALPEDTPLPFLEECRLYGAETILVQGTIADAGAYLKQHGPHDAFDVSTLREPYRIEGKKTMAYELVEQLGFTLPDVILYPTGGGTGLIGMWKAFGEMEALGWIPAGPRPRLVSVQAAGCAPVVKAYSEGVEATEPWRDASTTAYGLRVPSPLGGFLCVRAVRETGGVAVAVAEEELHAATRVLAARTGLDIAPEGGAAYAALQALRKSGWVRPADRVVLFNTGTGLKYR